MNRRIKILATLFVAATFAFAGCEKDNITPIVPETPEEETPENIYVGTSWVAHMENDYTLQEQGYNIAVEVTYDVSLDFLDSTLAEMFHDIYMYVPVYPAASQSFNQTEQYAYTFSDDSLFLSAYYIDDQSGDTVYYSYSGVHDTIANTITIDLDDPDMAEIMGTSILVFTPREEPAAKTTIPRPQTQKGKSNWHSIMGRIAHAIGL
ncbi:MAG: hypothetical protein IJK84_04575 [Bacteroidales bacterium]|nr:hypothetical protein [Bacteroidales bacterium]